MEEYKLWFAKEFDRLSQSVEILFPYYVETRYPFGDDLVTFDQAKADEALQAASKIIKFVEEKL